MNCEHKNTIHFHVSKFCVDVEMCTDCGMSRSEWEQGGSQWIVNHAGLAVFIQQQAAELDEAKKVETELIEDNKRLRHFLSNLRADFKEFGWQSMTAEIDGLLKGQNDANVVR